MLPLLSEVSLLVVDISPLENSMMRNGEQKKRGSSIHIRCRSFPKADRVATRLVMRLEGIDERHLVSLLMRIA